MASSLGDIINSRQPTEPKEVLVIKSFIKTHFKSDCRITVSEYSIIIGVNNAALAGALRLKLHQLQKQIDTSKRISIRIGT